ncbi:MAG: MFS transporter [Candidatus Lokiarchaeota archaeon]|nr:MFS transporter [Candidatus Lokiarchaeota archaeon]MBD3339435.1 MFS transporter [Candidatus Lokiarchaeota archaeon]
MNNKIRFEKNIEKNGESGLNETKNGGAEVKRFGIGQKLAFGQGSFAAWFINSAFNVWVFTFYFTAVRLPVIYIMLAFILWTIWNAINDPLIGYLSDRTHTRWGRRKPYIILGTIPVLIIEIILWIPPTTNHIITFIYLLIILVCYDTFYTMVTLSFDALFPELYTSVKERAQVNTIKQVFSTIGLICAFLIPGLFINDISESMGYLINGIVTTIIVGATLFIGIVWGAKEREEFAMDHQHEFDFIKGIKYAFKNKGFVLYTLMFFFYEYVTLLLATVVQLYGKHILHSTPFQTSLLLGVMFIVGIFTVVIWMKLDIILGSRKAYAIAIIVYILGSLPLLFVTNYLFALITVVFMGIGFGGMLYFIYLIIADVIDEDELETGVRREGSFFGITNFFMRLAMILSIVTVSLVFTSTGWEEYAPNPGANIILGLRILIVVFPGIALGLTLLCLYLYPYPKERVEEIKTALADLHNIKMERVRKKE